MKTIARRAVTCIAVVGALLLTTACNNPASPAAANVDGTKISRDALFDEARVYAALPDDPFGYGSDVEQAYASEALAGQLSTQVTRVIVEDAAKRFGIEADPAVVEGLRGEDLGPYADLPTEYLDRFISLQALTNQVLDYVDQNEWWTPEELDQYRDLVADNGQQQACVRHILVETEDQANAVVAELENGADFAEIAASESIDTGSAPAGGDLGCNAQGSFVAEFEDAIQNAEAGELVGPVQTEFGYHVILVDSPYEVVGLDQAGSDGWIQYILRTVDVDIDARFGRWDTELFQVVPPDGAQLPASDGSNLPQ